MKNVGSFCWLFCGIYGLLCGFWCDVYSIYSIYKFSRVFFLGVRTSIQRSKKGTNLAVNSGCFMLFHFSESRLYMADTLEGSRYSPASPT